MALDGGVDGLDFYRRLADLSHKFLEDNGVLFLECGIEQAKDIKNIFENNGNYLSISIINDINGIERIIRVVKR